MMIELKPALRDDVEIVWRMQGIIDKMDGSRKRISPIWIMEEYRGRGYAQAAMEEAERIYGKNHWCLDTIDIVFYEKD